MKREEYFAAELSGFERAFTSKRLRPLFAAVEFCDLHKLPLPEWAASAVMTVILERQHLPGLSRGAGNSPKAQARNDYVDYERWLVLSRVLKRRGLPPQTKRTAAGKPTKQEAERRREYDDAYAEACEMLKTRKREAGMPKTAGEPAQVKASFDRIEIAKANGTFMPW